MPRTKKDAKIFNIKLATPINDQLEQFCEETGLNKTTATEKIMENSLRSISVRICPIDAYSSNYLYPRDFLLGIMRYIYEQY